MMRPTRLLIAACVSPRISPRATAARPGPPIRAQPQMWRLAIELPDQRDVGQSPRVAALDHRQARGSRFDGGHTDDVGREL